MSVRTETCLHRLCSLSSLGLTSGCGSGVHAAFCAVGTDACLHKLHAARSLHEPCVSRPCVPDVVFGRDSFRVVQSPQ